MWVVDYTIFSFIVKYVFSMMVFISYKTVKGFGKLDLRIIEP